MLPWFVTAQWPAEHDRNLQRQVHKLIKFETKVEFYDQEGALIIVRDGHQIYACGIGAFKEIPLDEIKTLGFRMGGLSKTVVAWRLRSLEKEGISLDQGLRELYPSLENRIHEGTVDHLLSHQMGFHREPRGLNKVTYGHQAYARLDLQKLEEEIVQSDWKTAPMLYSHVGYYILGKLVEELSNQSIESWWRESREEGATCEAISGFTRGGIAVPAEWSAGPMSASLGLVATPEKMLWYLDQMIFNEEMEILLHKRAQTPFHDQIYVGDAWYILDYEKYPIALHSGRSGGHYAYMGFVRETQTGVIILGNCEDGYEDLGNHILRMVNKGWKKKPSNGKKEE